eukprot:8510701-Pyramimonas_sp.AAC.1
MPCAEGYTSVDSCRLSTVELKSMDFLAVDSGACGDTDHPPVRAGYFSSTWNPHGSTRIPAVRNTAAA